jgi:photosystem II stability/assembly factor-like uncharacterized protein
VAKSKTKTRRAAPRHVQSPQPLGPGRRPDWPFWLAAAAPFVLAGVLGLLLVSQRGGGPTVEAPPAASTLPVTPDYHSLLVAPGDPDHLWLGTHVGLHESTDGGRSWSEAGLSGQDAMNLARTPGPRSKTVWTAGHNVLAKSTDGGESWADVRPAGLPSLDVHGFATDPRNDKTLWAAVAGEGLFRSTDGGQSFSPVSKQVGPGVMALGVSPSGRVLAGDMEQGLMASTDEGQTWTQVLPEALMGLAINPRTPANVLATGQSGIWSSSDGGSTWRIVHPLVQGAGPVAWAASAPKTAYAVGFDRVLYKTTDAGASWQPV